MLIAEHYQLASDNTFLGDAFFEVPTEITTVVLLGRDTVRTSTTLERPSSQTLAMLRALDSVMIEDSEGEPPDFSVPGDDLGF